MSDHRDGHLSLPASSGWGMPSNFGIELRSVTPPAAEQVTNIVQQGTGACGIRRPAGKNGKSTIGPDNAWLDFIEGHAEGFRVNLAPPKRESFRIKELPRSMLN
jgi:hypothetical protein